jgi:hypothetical protein
LLNNDSKNGKNRKQKRTPLKAQEYENSWATFAAQKVE